MQGQSCQLCCHLSRVIKTGLNVTTDNEKSSKYCWICSKPKLVYWLFGAKTKQLYYRLLCAGEATVRACIYYNLIAKKTPIISLESIVSEFWTVNLHNYSLCNYFVLMVKYIDCWNNNHQKIPCNFTHRPSLYIFNYCSHGIMLWWVLTSFVWSVNNWAIIGRALKSPVLNISI